MFYAFLKPAVYRSNLGGRSVDSACVAVEEPVEGAVPEGGREDAPQANHEEDEFDLNRGHEINHDHRRTEDSTHSALPPTNVPHALPLRQTPLKRLFREDRDARGCISQKESLPLLDENPKHWLISSAMAHYGGGPTAPPRPRKSG